VVDPAPSEALSSVGAALVAALVLPESWVSSPFAADVSAPSLVRPSSLATHAEPTSASATAGGKTEATRIGDIITADPHGC
jgi:hypothetical protein